MWPFNAIIVPRFIGAARDGLNTLGKSIKTPKPLPADYGKEKVAPHQDILKESMAAYNIAFQEEQAGLAAAPTLPATDYDVEPEHTMEYQTTEDSDVQIVGSD